MPAPDDGGPDDDALVPNYFAVDARQGFPAKHFFTGDPERGLKMCIGRGPWRPGRVEAYLAGRPRGFAQCFESLGRAAGQQLLDDWQAHLWNRIVSAWLSRRLGPEGRAMPLHGARLVTWAAVPRGLGIDALDVPLPHPFAEFEGEWRELAAEVIGAEGTTVEGLTSHDLRSLKLHAGTRAVSVPRAAAAPGVRQAHDRAVESALKRGGPVGPKRDRG